MRGISSNTIFKKDFSRPAPIVAYINVNLADTAIAVGPDGDTPVVAGQTCWIAANSTLQGRIWAATDTTWVIDGNVFADVESYSDNVQFTVGTTGTLTVPLYIQMNQANIVNSGVIQSLSNVAIRKYSSFGVEDWSDDLNIYNTGSIIGHLNNTFDGEGVINSFGMSTEVVNFGFIGGTDLAIRVASGVAYVENHGTIDGSVQFETSEHDLVVNSGTIYGNVFLGDGNDVYRAIGDGSVEGLDGTINGESGNDTILGGDGGDKIFGGLGIDRLNGRRGDDVIDGGSQNDVIHGNAGDDDILGGGGQDSLFGDAGDDTMDGGFGNDSLNGGLGDDRLSGEAGSDTFIMTRHNGNDTITDFADGVDQIDISSFGIQIGDFATDVAPGLSGILGGSTVLDLSALGGTGSVVIEGMALADITAADFIF